MDLINRLLTHRVHQLVKIFLVQFTTFSTLNTATKQAAKWLNVVRSN